MATAQVAVVTGGASGMGLGLVERLIQLGWNVTIFDFNEAQGARVRERLGSQVLFVRGNVIKYDDQVEAFVQTWKAWGRIDVVWANAGIGDRIDFVKPASEMSNGAPCKPDTLVVDICLTGAIYSSYLALHYFRKNRSTTGLLVMTSSMAGIYPASTVPLYGAAKHGVVGLTRSLAARLKQKGEQVRVCCVCPGFVPTPLVSSAITAIFPKEMTTPVATVVRAIEGFIDDPTISGAVAECSAEDILYRPVLPFGNRASEYTVNGEYGNLVDPDEMAKDSEEKGRKLSAMLAE